MALNNQNVKVAAFTALRAGLCLGGFVCATAWADITIEGTHYPGFSGGVDRQMIYLRDDQMRIDQLVPDGNGTESAASNRVRVLRRDETWEILGQRAQRYDFSFSGNVDPLVLLGDQMTPGMAGMLSIKLTVSGTSWVVPGMEGATELAGFFAALANRQLAVRMPGQHAAATGSQGSVVSPGLSRALTDVMARITREGFPLLVETRARMVAAGLFGLNSGAAGVTAVGARFSARQAPLRLACPRHARRRRSGKFPAAI